MSADCTPNLHSVQVYIELSVYLIPMKLLTVFKFSIQCGTES